MIIDCQQVSHAYDSKSPVLNDFTLRINSGGIIGLCGPNGEGKTTLLKLIAGLQFPDSGQLSVLGHEPRRRPLDFLQRLYFLSSEPYFPNWTPLQIAHYRGALYPNFDVEVFRETLDSFGLDPGRKLGKVSFGQKRRVQLSFALATRTQLLLLDEPTNGLDIQGKDQFRRSLIAATEAGQTILIASHLLGEIAPVLDQVVLLKDRTVAAHLDLEVAQRFYSFTQTSVPLSYADTGYARRVPGGWLAVHADGRPSNAAFDLETLYLALTEGGLSLPAAAFSKFV
jgi:ABC-2 type transport system ATP-binding protein